MILTQNIKAQSTIEFTFGMIVIMFLIYGMVQTFRWAGLQLAQGRFMQDTSLTTLVLQPPPGASSIASPYWGDPILGQIQVGSVFGSIFGESPQGFSSPYADPASELNADLDTALPLDGSYYGKITNGNNNRP